MRLPFATVTFLFALSCAQELGARPQLRARQETTATATDIQTSTTVEDSSRAPEPTQSRETDKNEDDAATTTSEDAEVGDATSVITARPIETSLTTSNSNLTFANGTDIDPNDLPIQPELTPALGVAGAILMSAGLGLGFVGIKHRPTQTFLSTSLLIALGIEVLIVYLMSPPISKAVQGAYLIAGVVGGAALGALALIFKEVSEGFGCLLGGFSLAMWLLVLSPGGLIKNKPGKIILIGLFCAASFSLYISRFTRVYGIIACTSFAGAYAFILGIDCFSRAGLKEFWVYIWDINPDVFPPFVDSYPITRDMRAEIGAVIVITCFGVLSQIKIWKIVKEQKAKREADRLAEQEARDVEEAEVGRDIEAQVARERGDWEGQYEGKKTAEARIDSVAESEKDLDIEANEIPPRSVEKRLSSGRLPSLMTRNSAASLDRLSASNKRSSTAPSLPPLEFDSHHPAPATSPMHSPLASSAGTPGLGISHAGSRASSNLDVPSSERRTREIRPLSMAPLSAHHAMQETEPPFEVQEDDVASSIAATAAEAPDMDALSVRLSRPGSLYMTWSNTTTPMQQQEPFVEDEDDEALCLHRKSTRGSRRGSSPRIPTTPHGARTGEGSYFAGASIPKAESQEDLKDRLPKKLSRAASTYRTNEWAKEVSRAEPVPLEEVEEHTSDAVQVEMADAATAARAEENNAAPPPPPPPPAPPAPKTDPVAKVTPKADVMDAASKRLSVLANPRVPQREDDDWDLPLAKRLSGMSSTTALNNLSPPARAPSRNASLLNLAAQRPSSPAIPTRADTSNGPQSAKRWSLGPRHRSSTTNLLDARQDRLDARLTTTSFMTANPQAPPSTSSDNTSKGGSKPNTSSNTSISDTVRAAGNEIDEEDMTLAERKAHVKRQSSLAQYNASAADLTQHRRLSVMAEVPANPWRSSLALPTTNRRMSNPIYDSHQPQEYSNHDASKQATNWSQWRNSAIQVDQQHAPVVNTENQMDMLRAARMQAEVEKKMRDDHKRQMQAQMDQHMRMGGMNDAHQAALLRMQSRVKE
ncbi:hypothetical protein CBER1_08104 [Cercospora berteroae]|uniref:TM7S3/TM198-like domain-containing protein n=1 Tax=Cercospora berteroae TaxID=357750 RepID=A0A2S6BTC9_9PEZI|nr:hypothetical protein CBER1_08104 [Cercospora berteroae]